MDDVLDGVVEGILAKKGIPAVSPAAFNPDGLSIAHQRTVARTSVVTDRDKYAKTPNVWRFVIRGEAYFPQEIPDDPGQVMAMIDLVFLGHQSSELPVVEYEYVDEVSDEIGGE